MVENCCEYEGFLVGGTERGRNCLANTVITFPNHSEGSNGVEKNRVTTPQNGGNFEVNKTIANNYALDVHRNLDIYFFSESFLKGVHHARSSWCGLGLLSARSVHR